MGAFSPAFGQQSESDANAVIDRNITIEREYQPVIEHAGKINTLPNFLEPTVSKPTPYYADFNLPIGVERSIHYLSAAELTYQKKQSKEGYARVGVGTGFNSLADFAFPLIKKEDTKLDFVLNHYGLFNAKAHSTSQAALLFDKKFKSFDLYAGLGGSHEYFKYYGSNFNAAGVRDISDLNTNYTNLSYTTLNGIRYNTGLGTLVSAPDQNTFWRMNAYTGFRNSPVAEFMRYDVQLNYNFMQAGSGRLENILNLDAKFNFEAGENRAGLNFSSQNQFYKIAPVAATLPTPREIKNNYILYLNPYYDIERTSWDLHLGVKSSFSFAKGRVVNISPDVRFEWRPVPANLAFYAGVGGGYEINTLNSLHQENPYLSIEDRVIDNTYTPASFYGGLIVKPVNGLLLDAFIDYSLINDQYFFANKAYTLTHAMPAGFAESDTLVFTNRFETVYSNARLLKIGGRVAYTYHDKFSAQLTGAYNHWNVKDFEYAWHKPGWELDFNVNVHFTPKLSVYGNLYLAGKRYAMLADLQPQEMKTMINLNMGANYAVKDWLSVFLRFNNLLNNKYEPWYGYEAQGFNVMAGAGFNF